MKIALVHDWLNNFGGAEKVVREILHCFPDAEVYCLFDFLDPATRNEMMGSKKPHVSFLRHFQVSKRYYRLFLPLFPVAIKSFDLKDYDLVISSSSCCAKGVRTRKDQLHICYCHSPIRYAWDLKKEYLGFIRSPLSRVIVSLFLNRIMRWDLDNNPYVDVFIANSEHIRSRIQENYGRQAVVIHPPVNIDRFEPTDVKEDYYLTVSRLVSYKRIDMMLDAFRQMPERRLEVVGDGPGMKKLMKQAPSNVTFHGFLSNEVVKEKMCKARAFLAVAHEDFGITVVEAQACGTPVIVPALGGYLETVTGKTGIFLKERTAGALVEAINKFEERASVFRKEDFQQNIYRFRRERFHNELTGLVREEYERFYGRKND